jgi:uncharacterized membrane protein
VWNSQKADLGAHLKKLNFFLPLLLTGIISLPTFANTKPLKSFEICNKSNQDIHISNGFESGSSWVTVGWQEIHKGTCIQIEKPIPINTVIYLGIFSKDYTWPGSKELCVLDTLLKGFKSNFGDQKEACESSNIKAKMIPFGKYAIPDQGSIDLFAPKIESI